MSIGGWFSTAVGAYNAYTGGNSGGGSSGGNGINWGQAILGGISAYASSSSKSKQGVAEYREKGMQDRKTGAFAADLTDYYAQANKQRKRLALDTYGQFSLTNRYAPNMTAPAPIAVPNKPGPGA